MLKSKIVKFIITFLFLVGLLVYAFLNMAKNRKEYYSEFKNKYTVNSRFTSCTITEIYSVRGHSFILLENLNCKYKMDQFHQYLPWYQPYPTVSLKILALQTYDNTGCKLLPVFSKSAFNTTGIALPDSLYELIPFD